MLLIFFLTLAANAERDIYKRQPCGFKQDVSIRNKNLIEIKYSANRPCTRVNGYDDRNALPSTFTPLIKRFKVALKMLALYFFK